MTGDLVPVKILTLQLIANVSPELAQGLGLGAEYKSVGIISTDSDDATYIALDEATKRAAVDVVYAKSFYAGAPNATTRLAGEVIGILGGPNPSEVTAGLQGAAEFRAAAWGSARPTTRGISCIWRTRFPAPGPICQSWQRWDGAKRSPI